MIHGKKYIQLIVITENKYAEECVSRFQRQRCKKFEVTGVIAVDKNRTGEQ